MSNIKINIKQLATDDYLEVVQGRVLDDKNDILNANENEDEMLSKLYERIDEIAEDYITTDDPFFKSVPVTLNDKIKENLKPTFIRAYVNHLIVFF